MGGGGATVGFDFRDMAGDGARRRVLRGTCKSGRTADKPPEVIRPTMLHTNSLHLCKPGLATNTWVHPRRQGMQVRPVGGKEGIALATNDTAATIERARRNPWYCRSTRHRRNACMGPSELNGRPRTACEHPTRQAWSPTHQGAPEQMPTLRAKSLRDERRHRGRARKGARCIRHGMAGRSGRAHKRGWALMPVAQEADRAHGIDAAHRRATSQEAGTTHGPRSSLDPHWVARTCRRAPAGWHCNPGPRGEQQHITNGATQRKATRRHTCPHFSQASAVLMFHRGDRR